VGTLLSGLISQRWLEQGLPDGCIDLTFTGSAGQSFGAFGVKGLHFVLRGEANDYFGKGLSGARLIVLPRREAKFEASEQIIIGNVALMGATSGAVFIRGLAGERFAVRNSGATAVVEGLGDHGCEYMTGGTVVVLGHCGRNFGAGMTGGQAFVYDPEAVFPAQCNPEQVDLDPLDANDLIELRQLIRNHFLYTGSTKALFVLQDWVTQSAHFVKIMPRDYKNVLAQKSPASQLSPLAAVKWPIQKVS
jgi:glutamate synthase (NADPH/NADH) large chain